MRELGPSDHIIEILHHVETSEYLYLVLELCPGGDAKKYVENEMKKGASREFLCRKFCYEVSLALLHCRHKGVVHRDIKPDNVLVSADGRFILGDFGLSRELDYAANQVHSTGLGTSRYNPRAEVEKGIYATVDLFCLSVSIFELAIGRLPFGVFSTNNT